jgi:hypothetical protein
MWWKPWSFYQKHWPRHWAPPWQIFLRLAVYLPAMVFKIGFCLCVLIGWGWEDLKRTWKEM